jgi:hypothetical protein
VSTRLRTQPVPGCSQGSNKRGRFHKMPGISRPAKDCCILKKVFKNACNSGLTDEGLCTSGWPPDSGIYVRPK